MHLQPILKPLALKEVPKVIQAMRQTQSRKVLVKLLTRIKVSLFRLACCGFRLTVLPIDVGGPVRSSADDAITRVQSHDEHHGRLREGPRNSYACTFLGYSWQLTGNSRIRRL